MLLIQKFGGSSLADRERLYREEGERYFQGSLYIPADLDCIEL